MPETSQPSAPVLAVTLTRGVTMRLAGYGILLFYLALGIVSAFPGIGATHFPTPSAVLISGLAGLAVMAMTIVAHEGVHGWFMRRFGGSPRYGVALIGWVFPYAYAASPGTAFTLPQATVICLAPFVLLSIAPLVVLSLIPAVSGYAAVAFVTNFSGAVGDLWLVWHIWQFRGCRELRIVDTMEGVNIHTPDATAHPIVARLSTPQQGGYLRWLLLHWIAATTALLTCVMPFTLLLALLDAPDVTIGPSQFALFVFHNLPEDGVGVTVDVNAMLAAGFLFAVLSLIIARPSRTTPGSRSTTGKPPRPVWL